MSKTDKRRDNQRAGQWQTARPRRTRRAEARAAYRDYLGRRPGNNSALVPQDRRRKS